MFKLNKELLDLNAMEMDDALVRFFGSLSDISEPLEFVNEEGVTRKFNINLAEKLLQGRGIKGFFAQYNARYLFIESLPEGKVFISSLSPQKNVLLKQVDEKLAVKERMETVVQAMNTMQQDNEAWFDLYHEARGLVFPQKDSLICLPHLRNMETYNYQLKTVRAVIERFKGRALLCDEVGLGKTVEAGICMLEYIMRGLARKILILVPPSLINQWHEEMKQKFNQDFIRSDDPVFVRMGSDAWNHYPKVIASISSAKRSVNSSTISQIHYDLVIADEAHHLKNRATVAWQFVNSLKKNYILLLTATPVQNSLEELYNLITLLKPGQLKTYSYFRKNFVEDNEGIEAKNVTKLKGLLNEVMIRNRRSNVDVKFTKRSAHTKTVELSVKERELYDDLSRFIRNYYMEKHPILTRFLLKQLQEQMGSTFFTLTGSLQKLAVHEGLGSEQKKLLRIYYERAEAIAQEEHVASAKITELAGILSAFQDKMLVFTKYRATQEVITRSLRERGLRVAEFHGGLLRKEKESQIAFFKEKADVLVSTEVGGEGRNLQFCNGMVNFDLPWNPMAIEQRIGRIHRIGQARDVFVYNLAAQHTLEHYMLQVLDRKINMFEMVIGEVDMILGDIEESEEFSDLVMNAWVRSVDDSKMEQEMEQIGEKLLENKNKLQKVKELDEHLFANQNV